MACYAQEIGVVKEDASASSIGGTDAQALFFAPGLIACSDRCQAPR